MELVLFCVAILVLVLIVGRSLLALTGLVGHTLAGLSSDKLAILERSSLYFQKLDHRRKKEFARRVKEFIFEKDWFGRGITMTSEMQVRISAAAVQLTFGMPGLLLLHFRRIVVRPTQYRHQRTGELHVGEVMPGGGTIVLAWDRFIQDEDLADDGRNLGLHEMAHALWFEDIIPNAEDELFDPGLLKQWKLLAREHAERINRGSEHFLRKYAATDQAEFFAVSVEYFFELPHEFAEAEPELYALLAKLLKQDPRRLGA